MVRRDELVANIETDKITLPVTAPDAGKIVQLFVDEGDTVTVGSELFKIDTIEDEKLLAENQQPQKKEHQETSPEPAAEAPVRPADKPPKDDRSKPSAPEAFQRQAPARENEIQPSAERSELRKRMSPMRLKIAAHLKESQNTNASLTTFNEIDMSSCIEFRALYKDTALKTHGIKLGYMSPFILAAARCLQEMSMVNSRIEGSEIVTPSYVDISVAVATPKGLVTPVIRDCQKYTSFIDIERQLSMLAELARSNELTQEHLRGGTFTISNGGIFGSLSGTPIINLPQSAILGMHAIKDRPVVVDGKIVVRPMMNVALTYDHRIIDGREAVTFLVRLKALLEDPRLFLL